MRLCEFLLFLILSVSAFSEEKTARLLISIDKEAAFSPDDFALASSAYLAKINLRNPFKDMNEIFLNHDFVVLSGSVDEQMLCRLARRFGYRFAYFKEESLEVATEQTVKLLEEAPKVSSEIPMISVEQSNAIYALLKQVDHILTKNQITYWATGGTLIGSLSFHGLIPWDDDVDLCILDVDEKTLLALGDEFKQNGLELHHVEESDFYKISNLNGNPIENLEQPGTFYSYRYPFIDIFVMTLGTRREIDDIYVHKSRSAYCGYPYDYFHYSQIETIHRVPFGPLTVPIPSDAEQWIEKNYGIPSAPGLWKTFAAEPIWSHQFERYLQTNGASFVKIDDFTPVSWAN